MEIIFELEEIGTVAKQFLKAVTPYKVLAFTGELGAGKTTLITALCKELGVEERVTSPTFSIIQEYRAIPSEIVFHIDLYRIRSAREAMDAGVEDCVMSQEICMVEWPEKAPQIFPDDTVYTAIEVLSASKRKLLIQFPR